MSFILSALVLMGAVASLTLRNLVHCALALVLTFLGLAGLYLNLGVPFVGWVQILVYVGAVGILLVFAVLLTQSGGQESGPLFSTPWYWGAGASLAMAIALCTAWIRSPSSSSAAAQTVEPKVQDLGVLLMNDYVLPLEVMGLLLTAALIGAMVIAMPDPARPKNESNSD